MSDEASPPAGIGLRLNPRSAAKLERALVIIAVILVLAHVLTSSARRSDPPRSPVFLWSMWGLGFERSVGTWYAIVQLALAASLAGFVARAERHSGLVTWRWWASLAFLLVAASAEELLGFHELLDSHFEFEAVRERLQYPWVVAGVALSALLGIVFARFILGRSPPIRWRLLLGGTLFVLGAVGFEALGGGIVAAGGDRAYLALTSTIEESLELLGAALVVAAAARQLAASSA